MMNVFVPTGECCDKHIAEAIASGSLDASETWTCPFCELEWKSWLLIEDGASLRKWEPNPVVAVIR